MEVEGLKQTAVGSLVSVFFEQHVGRCLQVGFQLTLVIAETEFQPVIILSVVVNMPLAKLFVTVVGEMPTVVGGILKIGRTFFDRMTASTVETGLIDKIECQHAGAPYGECGVGRHDTTVAAAGHKDATEMNTLLRRTDSMASHGELSVIAGLDMMGHLRSQHNTAVDASWLLRRDAHGNHFVGVIGEILTVEGVAVLCVLVMAQRLVEVQLTGVCRTVPLVVIKDMQGAKRLKIL